jgi:hypothetical protein
MQSLILRAQHLDLVTAARSRSLHAYMNKLGYLPREPNPVEREVPELVREVVSVQLNEHGYTPKTLGRLLGATEIRSRPISLQPGDSKLSDGRTLLTSGPRVCCSGGGNLMGREAPHVIIECPTRSRSLDIAYRRLRADLRDASDSVRYLDPDAGRDVTMVGIRVSETLCST